MTEAETALANLDSDLEQITEMLMAMAGELRPFRNADARLELEMMKTHEMIVGPNGPCVVGYRRDPRRHDMFIARDKLRARYAPQLRHEAELRDEERILSRHRKHFVALVDKERKQQEKLEKHKKTQKPPSPDLFELAMTERRPKTPPSMQDFVDYYGGYHLVPDTEWASYRVQLAAWMALHRSKAGAVVEASDTSDDDPLANLIPLRDAPSGPPVLCVSCGKPGRFGYKSMDGSNMDWFCAEHRLAKFWADARR